jgi:predicted nucleotidyltransferase component of viral defense system
MVDVGTEDFYFKLREELIIAVFSDDVLADKLVLKGGNALNVVHRIGERTSLDLDYSMTSDLEDVADVRKRLFAAIRARLEQRGLVVFDEKFGPRPENPSELSDPKWGGYSAQFKVTDKASLARAEGDLAHARRTARTVEPNQQSSRVFHIELSRFEYCGSTEEKILRGFTIHVYTPQAIAAEKLRSLCQQMPGGGRKRGAARARDFYDIHALVTTAGVDFSTPEYQELLRKVFEAKGVLLALLGKIKDQREFHRLEWPRVVDAVGGGKLESFDFYFEFVLKEVERLKPLWMENTP